MPRQMSTTKEHEQSNQYDHWSYCLICSCSFVVDICLGIHHDACHHATTTYQAKQPCHLLKCPPIKLQTMRAEELHLWPLGKLPTAIVKNAAPLV